MNVNKQKNNWVRLGDYIEPVDERNSDLSVKLSQGISNSKVFQSPKQVAENSYADKIVRQGQFAYNKATTRNGEKISIAYREDEDCTVSSAYQIFKIINENKLNPHFLWLFFSRSEFDRYARYMSQGSAHEFFEFDEMCRVQIPLPSIETQRELVATYNGLKALAEQNEALIQPLTEACQAYIVDCKKKYPEVELGEYIEPCDERNQDLSVKLSQGISNTKEFQIPKQVSANSNNDKIVRTGQFAYNRATTRNGEKISIAYRTGEDCTVSSAYQVFKMKNNTNLNPHFLLLWFKRSEFDRYARYVSKGSAHEFFEFDEMCRVKIPLPPSEVQQAIVNLYNCAEEAKNIANEAREKMKTLCPALVQKAIHFN